MAEAKSQKAVADQDMGIHLALRTPVTVRAGKRKIDVVQEHSSMVEAEGRVALCKFGLPFSRKSIAVINSEIKAGKEPSFILITKTNGLFAGHIAKLAGFIDASTDPGFLRTVPQYYRDDELSVCAIITSPFKPVDLDSYYLQSNNRPIVEVLGECRTASMLIHD